MERLLVENKAKQEQEIEMAKQAEKMLNFIYNEQDDNLTTLNKLLGQIEASINWSQQLFRERAYSPFWEWIDNTVVLLQQFDRRVGRINEKAKEYYSNLAEREHTFPAFPIKSEQLPNPESLIMRLQKQIAEAQRDFQFSTIFEQRRTTSAVVAGFSNMQDAIRNLQNEVVNSISNLQSALESGLENISSNLREGFDGMKESQQQSAAELRDTLDKHAKEESERDAKHHKFTEAALDNIQNHREPLASETKNLLRK
jgi:hypothetical protein